MTGDGWSTRVEEECNANQEELASLLKGDSTVVLVLRILVVVVVVVVVVIVVVILFVRSLATLVALVRPRFLWLSSPFYTECFSYWPSQLPGPRAPTERASCRDAASSFGAPSPTTAPDHRHQHILIGITVRIVYVHTCTPTLRGGY